MNNKFKLGDVVGTRGAIDTISSEDLQSCLVRHAQGDWGDVCEEDREANEDALKTGERLLSVYHSKDGIKFYIITEWDRSVTTILLPEEY